MNSTLEYIGKRFNLDLTQKSPIEIRGISRETMCRVLHELDYKVGAEIGVAQGWHAEMICKENPQAKLYAVDVWDRYEGYHEYVSKIDKFFEEAKALLAPYNAEIVKKFSMDAVKDFPDKSLDFVYIDGAHDFKNVAMDIYEWSKKVRIGGMVFGHDYKRWKPGLRKPIRPVDVKDVVQAFMYSQGVHPWFCLANDKGDWRWDRDNPGWMYIRQDEDYINL